MTCRELIEFLMDYTDGSLGSEARAAFDRHLRVCASCRAYLDSYQRTISLVRESLCTEGDEEPVPKAVPADLVKAILDAKRRDPSVRTPASTGK